MSDNVILSSVQVSIQDAISDYLQGLRQAWEDSESLMVRISQIEAKILNIDGVLDVTETMINDQASNLEITQEYLPLLGNVEVSE